MEFQLSYFKKIMLWKCCTRYASRFGKLSSGHRTGKCQFSSQSQRRAVPKKCSSYCTALLISYANKILLRILQARLLQYVNWKLPDVQSGVWRGRGTRNHWIKEQVRDFHKDIYFCFIDYIKVLTGWMHKLFLRKQEYKIALPVSWESCM